MKIQKLDEQIFSGMNFLVYGQSGVGKTSLVKTLPTEETIVVSAESGLLSIADSKIDFVDITDGDDKVKNLSEFIKFIKQDTKYKYVFIDSLTEISQIIVEHLQNKYPDKRDSFTLWNDYNKYMKSFIRVIRDLKKVVIVTALEKHDKDELSRKLILPDVAGKIAFQSVALFDEVFHYRVMSLEDGSEKRALLTQAGSDYIAKDRSGKLGKIVLPNLNDIIKIIKEGGKK